MKSVFFSKQKTDKEDFFDITLNLNCPINVTGQILALAELNGRVQAKA